MIVNDNIKMIREAAGFTQAEFSAFYRISLSSLKNYENTDVMPKVELLNNISKGLKITVEKLINQRLTHNDINVNAFQMYSVGKKPEGNNAWEDAEIEKSAVQSNSQEKFIELQTEYIDTLKLQEEALSHFRDLLKDVNDQRMIDVKVLIGRTDELSKRLDRLEAQFDETRKGLYSMIQQVDGEFRKRLDDIEDEFRSYSKETDNEMAKFYERLNRIDPPQRAD